MNNRVNPEMIVLARESRGLTQKELASALNVNQATLSKFETGALGVDPDYVPSLSRVLRYPDGFFYQASTVRWSGSGCMYNRKRQSVSMTDYRHLLAKVNVLRLNVERLLMGVEIQTENKFFRMDIDEYGSAAKIAAHVRNAWNLPPGPVANLTTAIEASGGIVIPCDFGAVKLDAFSQWPPGFPPLFFVNVLAPTDRMRFTLAHEVGHIVMHAIPTPLLEKEADEFAAEFLMPKKDIIGDLGRPFTLEKTAQLKTHWRVAMSALIRRAHDLGRITDSHYRMLMTRMSARGWRTQEPVALDPERPTIMRSVVDLHLNEHGYSMDELCALANANHEDFARQFAPVEPTNRLRIVRK